MLWLAIAIGCRFDTVPLVEARGGGGGYWPRHSRTAVEGALELGVEGLEVDLTPTADGTWLLHQGLRWMDCIDERTGNPPQPADVLGWSVAEVRDHVRCGGTPDPARRNALVVAEAPITLGELLATVRASDESQASVHLHLRVSDTDPLADLLLGWSMSDLPNPLHVSVDDLNTLRALERERRTAGIELTTTLRLAGESDTETSSWPDAALWDALAEAGATGIALPVGDWSRSRQRIAQRRGFEIMALDADDPASWPAMATSVLTDFPGDRAP